MEIKRCSFCGHREVYDDSVYVKAKKEIVKLIENKNVREVYVGNYGEFDRGVASIIRKLKCIYNDISLVLVIPYLTKEINKGKEWYCEKYDHITIADVPLDTPVRYRIVKANEYMVDNSDFIISYVVKDWGGAKRTLDYAKRKTHITVINIAERE